MRRLLAGLGAVAGLTLGVITGAVLSVQPAHAEGTLGVELTSTVEVVADTADTTTNAVLDATAQINVDQQNNTSPSIIETVGEATDELLENAVTGGGTDTATSASSTSGVTLQTNSRATSTVDGTGSATADVSEIASVVANADAQVNLTQPTNEPLVDANVCAGVALGPLGTAPASDCTTGESSGGSLADVRTDGQVNVDLPVGEDDSQINGDICLDASVFGPIDNQCAENNQPDDAAGNPPANEPDENGLIDVSSVVDISGTVDPEENLPAQSLDLHACLDASVLGGAANDCMGSQDNGLLAVGSAVEVSGLIEVGDTPIIDLDNHLCVDASVLGDGTNDCTGGEENGLADVGTTVDLNNSVDLGKDLPAFGLTGDACIEASVLGNGQNGCGNNSGNPGGENPGGEDPGNENPSGEPGSDNPGGGDSDASQQGQDNPDQDDEPLPSVDGGQIGSNSAGYTPEGGAADVPAASDAGTDPNGGSGSGHVDVAATGPGNANGSGNNPDQDGGADDRAGRIGQSGHGPGATSSVPTLFIPRAADAQAHPVMLPAAPATNARNLMPNTGQPGARIAGASPGWLWMLLLIAGALSAGAGAALRRHRGQPSQSGTT